MDLVKRPVSSFLGTNAEFRAWLQELAAQAPEIDLLAREDEWPRELAKWRDWTRSWST